MDYIFRILERKIYAALKRKKSVLLFGARQTGKTTLIKRLPTDLFISLVHPATRQRYEMDSSSLTAEIEVIAETHKDTPIIIIDEIQKIPEILDVVQDLIDRKIAKFVLTGSSARKLKSSGKELNLLPGRVVVLQLDPLVISELPKKQVKLESLLFYGSLPGIVEVDAKQNKELDLASYVTVYLEEEIRKEALVRSVGSFAKFLTLASAESGDIVSFRKLSQEIGVAHTTIIVYYQILEDCLIAERIDPLLKTKTRRQLIKASKYLFFDLGLRRLAAKEGTQPPMRYMGLLFEQFVGLELIRCTHLVTESVNVYFWRDKSGVEVDWVIEKQNGYIPVEVKWTERPSINDAKCLKIFLNEYENADKAYIVCRTPRKMKLADKIYAIPWQDVDDLILK